MKTRPRRFTQAARSLTIVGLIFSGVSLFARSWWIADLIANLRIQLVLGLLAALLCAIAAGSWKLTGLSASLVLWQSSWLWVAVAPISTMHRGPELKVCTINVLSENTQYDLIVECLKETKPDVIAILELSSPLEEYLIRKLGDDYPHRLTEPQDNGNFGIGLFSRLPLQDAQVFHLGSAWLASIQADLLWNNQRIQILAVHPVAPLNGRHFRGRNLDLKLLAGHVQALRQEHPSEPIIVVGDLNLTPWSPLFNDFLAASDLRSGSQSRGLKPTWYRWPLFPFGLMLDHGLCSHDLACTERTVHGDIGSDHRPVTFRFAGLR